MEIEFLGNPPAAILRPRGQMNLENFRKWGETLLAHPDYALGTAQIVDLGGVDFSALGRSEIDSMVSLAGSLAYGSGTRIALVAPDQLSFGLSRMYEALADGGLPRDRAVFRTVEEAVDWLRQTRDAGAE